MTKQKRRATAGPRGTDIDWAVYWDEHGQPWRTEPEIDGDRQTYLAMRRAIASDIERGVYPFRHLETPLARADLEWLLATHEHGRGPIDWSDTLQRKRNGLDLRGADLRGLDLNDLPLTRVIGGLSEDDWAEATAEQREAAKIHLEGANLYEADLEEANLRGAYMEGANLTGAHLNRAALWWAHLEGASLWNAHLEESFLGWANLEGANLWAAHLEGAALWGTHLEGATLWGAHLEGAFLGWAHLEGKPMPPEDLKRVRRWWSRNQVAEAMGKDMTAALADLMLRWPEQRLTSEFPEVLPPADLRAVFFSAASSLDRVILGDPYLGSVSLADARWEGTNLAVVDWSQVRVLGDEREARRSRQANGARKDREHRIEEFRAAVRANRQLAVALQAQGLNEEAARFGYRAQVLQRAVLWRQWKPLSYAFSLFLWALAGNGYKPFRTALWYLCVITGFTIAYFTLGHAIGPRLSWPESLVISVTAFHGRGFFTDQFPPGAPQSFAAAAEAVIGLVIEISFIATFTQRFFASGK